MGWNAQPTRAVIFENAACPWEPARRRGDRLQIAMAGTRRRAAHIARVSLGGAQSALDKTLSYMKERKAFGNASTNSRRCNSRIADMATELEAGAHLPLACAAALDRKAPTHHALRHGQTLRHRCRFEVANQARSSMAATASQRIRHREDRTRSARPPDLEGTNEIMRLIVSRKLIEGARMVENKCGAAQGDLIVGARVRRDHPAESGQRRSTPYTGDVDRTSTRRSTCSRQTQRWCRGAGRRGRARALRRR